jgi:hypothetical protein
VPSEPGLRHLFDAPMPANPIDVSAVVRRSRARRLPKVLGVTGVSLLAIGGLVVGGLQVGGAVSPASDTYGLAAGSADSTELYSADEMMKAPADKLNFCAGTVAEMVDEGSGIVLSLAFPDAAAGSASVDGVVTMTNTSAEQWTGYSGAAPAITLSQDGVVLWHTNGPTIQLARDIDLAPGASVEYAASFEPVRCGIEDDAAESFRTTLPAVPAGQYQVSAAIDLMGEDGTVLVTGPPQTVTLY